MPPKPKITKEMVLESAFQIVREHGIDAMNVREIGTRMNCSTQPIFRIYDKMDSLKTELLIYIKEYFYAYLLKYNEEDHYFFNIGLSYIKFAIEEKNLFFSLFLTGDGEKISLKRFMESDTNKKIYEAMAQTMSIDTARAELLFYNMWIYSHGIAVMMVTERLTLGDQEIKEMLTMAYCSFLNCIKNGVDLDAGTTTI